MNLFKKFFFTTIIISLIIMIAIITFLFFNTKRKLEISRGLTVEFANKQSEEDNNLFKNTLYSLNKTFIDDTSNWKEYYNEDHGFSFKYPPNYEIKEVKEIRSVDRIFNFIYTRANNNLRYNGDLMVTIVGEYQGVKSEITLILIHEFEELNIPRHISVLDYQNVFDFTDLEELDDFEFRKDELDKKGYFLGHSFGEYERIDDIRLDEPIEFSQHSPWQRIIKGVYDENIKNNHGPNIISSLEASNNIIWLARWQDITDQEIEELEFNYSINDALFPRPEYKEMNDRYHNDRVWQTLGMPPEVRYYPAFMDQILILRTVKYEKNEEFLENLLDEYFLFKSSKCKHYNEWKHHGEEYCEKLEYINNSNLLGQVSWEDILLMKEKEINQLTDVEKNDIADMINQYLLNNKKLALDLRSLYPIRIDGQYKYIIFFDDTLNILDSGGKIKVIFPINKGHSADCSLNIDPQKNIDDVGILLFSCGQEEYRYNIISDELKENN